MTTSERDDLRLRLADCQRAHREDNRRLVDARQEQVNRAIVAEARVRELEAITSSVSVFSEVSEERAKQDAQWGGPEHDDQHALRDWLEFIEKQVAAANAAQANESGHRETSDGYLHVPELRRRLVKIAALAVAGVESIDRQYPF